MVRRGSPMGIGQESQKKRCLVPASAFYEWTHVPGVPRKVKYRISRSDGDPVALAGLWDYWHHEDQEIVSYRILTTVLGEEEWDEWLAP